MARARSLLLFCAILVVCGCGSPRWHREDRAWYMGAGVGRARASVDDCNPGETIPGIPENTCSVSSGTNTGGKLFGGYQFNRYFAVEAEHVRLGTFTQASTSTPCCPLTPPSTRTDTSAYSADLVYAAGIWPLTKDFGLLGQLGVGAATGGTALGVKIGAKYDFNRNVGVRLDYQQFSLFGPLDIDWHVDLLTANVVYYFR